LFADAAGYTRTAKPSIPNVKQTWGVLVDSFEIEMARLIANKARGASAEAGAMAEATRDRYRVSIEDFTSFLQERQISFLDAATPSLIEMFKVDRIKKIMLKKQSRGGSSVALDIAILHRVFAYAIEKGLMFVNPTNLKHESKPGKNPKNGARPFTASDLTALRKAAGADLFAFIVLRWTGLRVSYAINLM
jgi:site-specific recombinase XerD